MSTPIWVGSLSHALYPKLIYLITSLEMQLPLHQPYGGIFYKPPTHRQRHLIHFCITKLTFSSTFFFEGGTGPTILKDPLCQSLTELCVVSKLSSLFVWGMND